MICFCFFRTGFLSTPSARRATDPHKRIRSACKISIHALREEGDVTVPHTAHSDYISIHALREEGDMACSVLLP